MPAKKNKAKAAAARTKAASGSDQWAVAVYETATGDRPALDFLLDVPDSVRRELMVTVTAVCQRDPVKFRTMGERWTLMKKPAKKSDVDMRGIAEARDKEKNVLYRLFCLIDSAASTGRRVILIDGDSKPVSTAMPQSVYARVDGRRDDYWAAKRLATKPSNVSWWPGEG